jgi:hypothetical protein
LIVRASACPADAGRATDTSTTASAREFTTTIQGETTTTAAARVEPGGAARAYHRTGLVMNRFS